MLPSQFLASSSTMILEWRPFSIRRFCTSLRRMSTMRRTSIRPSLRKVTMLSMRLMNSGGKCAEIADCTSWRTGSEMSSSSDSLIKLEPRLLVIMMIVFRNDTWRPWLSCRRPSSRTCKNSCTNSRAAFSISSIKTIEKGRRRTASVSTPPSSNPT